ncbi:hypothetical protein HO517_08630 [Streptococcus suis]|nr:hypothetical protein [Streptococcus suis]
MSIKSLKHSISSLKLAKKATSAIFNDSIFSSLIMRHFDSDVPNNAFIEPNINSSPNSIYYNTIYYLLKQNEYSVQEIKAIALKFQKILSLEVQQNTIQRMLHGEYANHINNAGGMYSVFPETLSCNTCKEKIGVKTSEPIKETLVSINLMPTICKIWNHRSLLLTPLKIGKIVKNPFIPHSNHHSILLHPINLIVVYNGNHSANVALYEHNSYIPITLIHELSHWFDNVFFDPVTNRFRHLSCGDTLTGQKLFHANLGHIYEIARLLYQNGIVFKLDDYI